MGFLLKSEHQENSTVVEGFVSVTDPRLAATEIVSCEAVQGADGLTIYNLYTKPIYYVSWPGGGSLTVRIREPDSNVVFHPNKKRKT